LPAKTTALWNYDNETSSWGGNIVFDKSDGKWHLFFAELLNDCALQHWGTNSVVSHGIGDSPDGPFVKKEIVQPAFHHNPTIAYDPSSETFLLFSIGNGSTPGVHPAHCEKNATDDADLQLSHPVNAGFITLSHAPSANGPWTTLAQPVLQASPSEWDYFVTNPSVHIFDNGKYILSIAHSKNSP
jgi:hypothetical protein